MIKRMLVALAMALVSLGGVVVVSGTPATAAPGDCVNFHATNYGFLPNNGTTTIGGQTFTGVSQTGGFQLSPATVGCDKPYAVHNVCSTTRLIRFYRPSNNDSSLAIGPWVRVCTLKTALASGLGGWVQQFDDVYMQTRAEADGSHNPGGYLYN